MLFETVKQETVHMLLPPAAVQVEEQYRTTDREPYKWLIPYWKHLAASKFPEYNKVVQLMRRYP